MTLYAGGLVGDVFRAQMRTPTLNTNVWRAYVAIGAAGAPTATTTVDAAGGVLAITRNTTGVYDITYPIQAAIGTSVPMIRCGIMQSAASTVAGAFPKAFGPTAGTAQIVTYLATPGTPVDPANGDIIYVEITGASTVA